MGSSERKNRQKVELRQQILDAARQIVVRDGFGALTMRKIAEAIEYAPGTIYLYFENRDAIAKQLCLEGYQELLEFLKPAAEIADPSGRLRAIALSYISFGIDRPETYRLIFMEDPKFTNALLQGMPIEGADGAGVAAFNLLIGIFDELRAKDLLAKDTDSPLLAQVLWTGVHGIVSLKLTCPAFLTTSAADLGATAIDIFLTGLIR